MKIKLEQLSGDLKQRIKPIYWLSGDEPVLLDEAQSLILAATERAGFLERHYEVIEVDSPTDKWRELWFAPSLFAQKQCWVMHVQSMPNAQLIKELAQWAEAGLGERILIFRSTKLGSKQNNKGFTALSKVATMVAIWPLNASALRRFVEKKARGLSLQLTGNALASLLKAHEGNLYAMCNILMQLSWRDSGQALDADALDHYLLAQPQYSVFELTWEMVAGRPERCLQLWHALEDSLEPMILLWAIVKELRLLMALYERDGQTSVEAVLRSNQVFATFKAKTYVQAQARLSYRDCAHAIALAARLDRALKGGLPTHFHKEALLQLLLKCAGLSDHPQLIDLWEEA